ncbi:MAG: ferredoxin [Bacteroidales bacterium]
MIRNERDARKEQALYVARQMMTAARTAPKGKGMDIVEIAVVTDEDINRLSDEMRKLAEETGLRFIARDAENILHADAILLIGTAQQTHGLDCAYCGFSACGDKPETIPCAINSVDVGIAIGSACATATDLRVDTRVMFSAGLASQRLRYLGDCRTVFAIPISISSKNPFFDRVK